jgi:hypothetical protein
MRDSHPLPPPDPQGDLAFTLIGDTLWLAYEIARDYASTPRAFALVQCDTLTDLLYQQSAAPDDVWDSVMASPWGCYPYRVETTDDASAETTRWLWHWPEQSLDIQSAPPRCTERLYHLPHAQAALMQVLQAG